MQIDWFTFFAEIVNFLVLMFLLKRFLYNPVIKAMDQRERKIIGRLQEAEQKTQQAQQEADLYHHKQQELQQQKEDILAQAEAEFEKVRLDLMKKARVEVDATQAKWYSAIEQEKDSFMRELQQQMSLQICSVMRSLLVDLANTDLEQHIIEVFINRIQKLDTNQQEILRNSVAHSGKTFVYSAFEIPQAARQRIDKVVREQIANDLNIHFEIASELICGIELNADSYRISWSIDSYLATLEESLSTVFQKEVVR